MREGKTQVEGLEFQDLSLGKVGELVSLLPRVFSRMVGSVLRVLDSPAHRKVCTCLSVLLCVVIGLLLGPEIHWWS